MRGLTVFFQGILTLGVVIMMLVSGLMVVSRGVSVELAQSLGLLALFLGLLLVTERRMTGHWGRMPFAYEGTGIGIEGDAAADRAVADARVLLEELQAGGLVGLRAMRCGRHTPQRVGSRSAMLSAHSDVPKHWVCDST
jgi:hypothetical protein